MFIARLDNDVICGTTSTTELNPDIQVSVFPNPVQDVLTIQVASDDISVRQVLIVDPAGRTIWSNDRFSPGDVFIRCDLGTLSPGAYYVIITTEQGRRTLPIVKM
jgi:hypothetical protein